MIEINEVRKIVEEWLDGRDYFLVDVEFDRKEDKIVVEIDHAEGVWIEDCVSLSRFIGERFAERLDDYELEVGSAGIGQPFKVLEQYVSHVGEEVEVMTNDNQKLQGVLKAADSDGFTITIEKKVKPEGAKRPVMVQEDLGFAYDEIKYTKYLIRFK